MACKNVPEGNLCRKVNLFMKPNFKRFTAGVAALLIGTASMTVPVEKSEIVADAATSGNVVEYLDRGITAVNTGSGMLVSWRYLANDSDDAVFKLYRDNTLIYTSNAGDATCYLDAGGSASSTYKVETLSGSTVKSTDVCTFTSSGNYFDIKLDRPGSIYTPNDCSVGDVDGDGQYELFLKWDPSTSKDNSQKGVTDPCIIDCYRMDGTKLWRINLGVNIRSGAHYTQFFVADFDLDGKCEMTCKTGDGTVDGQGNVIGDASAVWRDSSGLIYSGPEYYTLFDCETGAALHTIDYEPGRGDPTKWGKSSDKYNRVERYWGVVAYLDGVTPSVVTGRGYYGRMTATAYKVENDKLVKLWAFDTGTSSSALGYGDGNHNSMPADVDGDGKQEIITGSTCIDDDGTIKWCTNQGHGDAMHVGDFLPDNNGIEVFICHEDSPYGVTLIDADTGSKLFHINADGDTGRCCAGNIWSENPGAEFWFNTTTVNGSGTTLSCRRPSINFMSYWDGDLEREALDGYTDSPATITDMDSSGYLTTILSTDGYYTCNTTKGTPCLSADIFGDWREELIVRAADGNSVRIFATTYDTDYRITTLMHDPQYRNQVAAQNVAYNQPPHPSFYLGSDESLPARPDVTIVEGGASTLKVGATMDTTNKYMFKNVNSGLYLEVAGGVGANGTNVQQGEAGETVANTWKLVDAGGGYYYIRSCTGDGKTYFLDLEYGGTDNGTNIGIWTNDESDARKFKFVNNGDGSYTIVTKSTKDASCLGVVSGSTEVGANVCQWECNGSDDQKWVAEKITIKDGITLDESKCYMFKNVASQKYLEIEGGVQANGTNVQQWGADEPASHNVWHVKAINWGYYYVYSALGDGQTWLLNVNGNGSDGTNIDINENNGYSSQYFKFVDNEDGTYTIVTRASRDLSCVAVGADSTDSGANILQWTINGKDSQKWIIEEVEYELPVVTTTTTTTTTVTTTTTTTTTTTATEETTTTTVAVEETKYGDADCSGNVELNDAVKIMCWIADEENNPMTAQEKDNADVYQRGDGVNNMDALAIQKKLAQLIPELPESIM